MVNATYFSYDGISSETYGLKIAAFTGLSPEPVEENEAFTSKVISLRPSLLHRWYHGGVEYDNPPQCEITIVSQSSISAQARATILGWLTNRISYKPLVFLGGDSSDFTYYCIFSNATTIYVNGICHGFKLTATFDSFFARGTPTIVTTTSGTHTITIENKSNIHDTYIYPKVQFTGNVNIINKTDDISRAFTFSGFPDTAQITVDCETKIIQSSIGGTTLDKFTSKNWLRLRRGLNTLEIESSGNVTVTCPYYALIGY